MTQLAALRDGQSSINNNPDILLFPRHARFVIIGLGLLGMSLLRAARSAWPAIAVDAYDNDPNAREYVRSAALRVTVHENIQSVPPADLFIICTPAGAVLSSLASLSTVALPGAIIMDVTSVKSAILPYVGSLLPTEVHYISAHPMAGGSTSGAAFGRDDLFRGKPCTLTPFQTVPADTLKAVEYFWRMVGSIPGVVTSPERHDDRVALTSHLPHVLAFAFMDTLERQELEPDDHLFIGRSLLDIIRLGAANPNIWRDIICMNREHILLQMNAFDTALQNWRNMLAAASDDEIAAALHHSVSVAKRAVPQQEPVHG